MPGYNSDTEEGENGIWWAASRLCCLLPLCSFSYLMAPFSQLPLKSSPISPSFTSPRICSDYLSKPTFTPCFPLLPLRHSLRPLYLLLRAAQVALVVKNPPASAGDARDVGSIPGSGSSPGVRSGNPLQYPFLENPVDRGAWWFTVHGVAKSQAQLSDFTLLLLPL